ncbi:MAG: hypothetical protein EOL95_09245 [Bacteroidia bacterium]|nr:hypothetical protein [Bacteroidia bacterium]
MARPTKRETINKRIGEGVSKKTPETLDKLRNAFSIDSTIEEACFYAGIQESTYYNWKKKDPKTMEDLEKLRLTPILKARTELVSGIVGFDNALKYLERKRKGEFSIRQEVESSVNLSVGESITDEEKEKIKKELKGE